MDCVQDGSISTTFYVANSRARQFKLPSFVSILAWSLVRFACIRMFSRRSLLPREGRNMDSTPGTVQLNILKFLQSWSASLHSRTNVGCRRDLSIGTDRIPVEELQHEGPKLTRKESVMHLYCERGLQGEGERAKRRTVTWFPSNPSSQGLYRVCITIHSPLNIPLPDGSDMISCYEASE